MTVINGTYESGLKNSNNDVLSAVDEFFYQWYPSTATPMEEV